MYLHATMIGVPSEIADYAKMAVSDFSVRKPSVQSKLRPLQKFEKCTKSGHSGPGGGCRFLSVWCECQY